MTAQNTDSLQYSDNPHPSSVSDSSDNVSANAVSNCLLGISRPQVLLSTMRAIVRTPYGNFCLRAILDQCAQASFITKKASLFCNLPYSKPYAQINGVCGSKPYVSRKFSEFTLLSNFDSEFTLNCNAFILPKITSYCPLPIEKLSIPNLEEYKLADLKFFEPGELDLLLGGDIYGDIILPQQRKFDESVLLQLTHFGWTISGPTSKLSYQSNFNINICSLDQQLHMFWEQEEILEKRQFTEEEELCEQISIKPFLLCTIYRFYGRV